VHIDFLIEVFEENRDQEALIWQDRSFQYSWLLQRISYWQNFLKEKWGDLSGKAVALEGDYSPDAVSLLLALIDAGAIIVPLSTYNATTRDDCLEISQAEFRISITEQPEVEIDSTGVSAKHELYDQLHSAKHPGLVLFSSGTSGKPKGAVHDFVRLLNKYKKRRHNLRTMAFLMFDHIGGVDTLFYSLSNGSCLIVATDRAPDSVCRTIENHRVEVLPVTPTFLNLLILSEAYKRHDLSSLKYITYGTEVMPQSTLARCTKIFPKVNFLQKFGTTETGTLRSKSRHDDSVWVRLGGEGFETRVVDGIFQIKAESAMLGYLNAPSPFTDDGWFVTGDEVEVDGEYIRFKGRKSEIINVGGEKVYPAEVENVIQQIDNVKDVTVYGEKNPLLGNIVCARVTLAEPEDSKAAIYRIKKICAQRLERFKAPVKVTISEESQHSYRFKKRREGPHAD